MFRNNSPSLQGQKKGVTPGLLSSCAICINKPETGKKKKENSSPYQLWQFISSRLLFCAIPYCFFSPMFFWRKSQISYYSI